MTQNKGLFIISLDFELFWGMHDVLSVKTYQDNIIGAHQAVKEMLKLFKTHHIHVTWAIVGMLYYSNLLDLKKDLPANIPDYLNEALSAYHYMNQHSIEEMSKKLFFAPALIHEISQTDYQEIATHTYAHYYTLEEGANAASFKADLEKALEIARKHRQKIRSIVFPRNQINKLFLEICEQHGITSYRGAEQSFLHDFKNQKKQHIRALRLIDHYVNLFGHQTYTVNNVSLPINLRASSYLMPYSKTRSLLEPLKLKRIKQAMTYAARNNEVYHLWWHPHNFGVNLFQNMKQLRDIILHYEYLKDVYQFTSLTMHEAAEQLSKARHFKEETYDYSLEKISLRT